MNGWRLDQIRNAIWPKMQGAANAKFGGDRFPTPDTNLTKNVLTDLPNVVGRTSMRHAAPSRRPASP
ncbi:hypothetical protein BO218_16055 [Microbacterium paludicola]|nr:hypothetical protein BO218_16055 [Microbacterium paludicola]